MKAIIPLAGKGTRLRPHTLSTPKPLVRVAGRPVMSYILEDLLELGITEIVFVVGYLREVVEGWVEEGYPQIKGRYVVQQVQDGTAGAVKLAEPYVDGDVLILFVDTLFDADLSLARTLSEEWAGVIWAKEVEDYQRFGVIVTGEDGSMRRIVEKPSEPISRLANIGLYYIRDSDLLFEGIDHALTGVPGPGGEFYLTDAFQYMVDQGARIRTAPVEGWYDCGKVETLLETNRHLLDTGRAGVSPRAEVEETTVEDPVRVEEEVQVRGSVLGPNVTLEAGGRVEASLLRNCIVGSGAVIRNSRLEGSIIGAHSRVEGMAGTLNVADYSEVTGSPDDEGES